MRVLPVEDEPLMADAIRDGLRREAIAAATSPGRPATRSRIVNPCGTCCTTDAARRGMPTRSHSYVHPSVNGSRVAPDVSIQIERVSVYSRSTSYPFSRPIPLAPNPPKGTLGPTTR